MYLLLFFLLVGAGVALARAGYVASRPAWLWGGVALVGVTLDPTLLYVEPTDLQAAG